MASGILLMLIAAFVIGHTVWGDWGKRAWKAIA